MGSRPSKKLTLQPKFSSNNVHSFKSDTFKFDTDEFASRNEQRLVENGYLSIALHFWEKYIQNSNNVTKQQLNNWIASTLFNGSDLLQSAFEDSPDMFNVSYITKIKAILELLSVNIGNENMDILCRPYVELCDKYRISDECLIQIWRQVSSIFIPVLDSKHYSLCIQYVLDTVALYAIGLVYKAMSNKTQSPLAKKASVTAKHRTSMPSLPSLPEKVIKNRTVPRKHSVSVSTSALKKRRISDFNGKILNAMAIKMSTASISHQTMSRTETEVKTPDLDVYSNANQSSNAIDVVKLLEDLFSLNFLQSVEAALTHYYGATYLCRFLSVEHSEVVRFWEHYSAFMSAPSDAERIAIGDTIVNNYLQMSSKHSLIKAKIVSKNTVAMVLKLWTKISDIHQSQSQMLPNGNAHVSFLVFDAVYRDVNQWINDNHIETFIQSLTKKLPISAIVANDELTLAGQITSHSA